MSKRKWSSDLKNLLCDLCNYQTNRSSNYKRHIEADNIETLGNEENTELKSDTQVAFPYAAKDECFVDFCFEVIMQSRRRRQNPFEVAKYWCDKGQDLLGHAPKESNPEPEISPGDTAKSNDSFIKSTGSDEIASSCHEPKESNTEPEIFPRDRASFNDSTIKSTGSDKIASSCHIPKESYPEPVISPGDTASSRDSILTSTSSDEKATSSHEPKESNPEPEISPGDTASSYYSTIKSTGSDEIASTCHEPGESNIEVEILDMNKDELQLLTDHMGHSLEIHTDIYKLQTLVLERTKVARLLLAMETGNLNKLRGNSLDEVNLEELPEPEEDDDNGKDFPELKDLDSELEDDSRKQEVSVNVEDNQNTAAKTKDLEKETKKAKGMKSSSYLVSGIISDCYKMHNFCMIKKFDTYILANSL
ncbi:hypothetical protein KUTeg_010715 [Tegillarca granosa]|uniref:Uncharacterized protein n=1 Tax=Tegillarca granosa TaxID=220873 RepID=A0ABQ9F1T7_TEGGR|nr:hypothetical protein KUTeg_010715 [Tegillarca granosa]